jgi:heat shock protein HslJ
MSDIAALVRMSYRWSTAAVVAALLLVSACGSTGTGDQGDVIDDGSLPPPPQVDGTAWQLSVGGGPDGDVVPVEGYPITIKFEGQQLSGSAACNTYSGTYRLEGNELSIEALTLTEIGCDPTVMTAEATYLAALQGVTEVTISGGMLVLGRSDTELIFVPQT